MVKEYKITFFTTTSRSDILDYIKNNSQEIQRLVGLKYEQLEQLIDLAIALNNQKQQDIEAKKVRIINKGGGRTR